MRLAALHSFQEANRPARKARRSDPTWVPLTDYTLIFEGHEDGYLDHAATGATKFYRLQITFPPPVPKAATLDATPGAASR